MSFFSREKNTFGATNFAPSACPAPDATRSSFAGAAIEVSDLARSVAFHRLWLPMLGYAV